MADPLNLARKRSGGHGIYSEYTALRLAPVTGMLHDQKHNDMELEEGAFCPARTWKHQEEWYRGGCKACRLLFTRDGGLFGLYADRDMT
ncbi:hypothetical protein J23TS9_47070 [Paenibacillus sp. J23TS9]|nr:hypothetical protein J23TS9_47070 [Paenibacillus sp. J23TS9]